MTKSVFILLILIVNFDLFGQQVIKTSAPISDFEIDGNRIITGTTQGTIEIYNIKTRKLIQKIQFPKTKDFTGDYIDTEVFKIAVFKQNIIAVVRGKKGFNDIYSIHSTKKTLLIGGDKIKSVVVDIAIGADGMLLLGLLSNELIKFDIKNKKQIYRKQISNYAFSVMSISKDKKYLFTTDESGIVHKVEVSSGNVVKHFKGENVDIVLSIDNAMNTIVCGGKDRRLAIYNTLLNSATHISYESFITTIAISKSATKVAWYNDITNEIVLVNLSSKTTIKKLKGHTSMVNKIIFVSENKIVSGGIDNQIIIWDL